MRKWPAQVSTVVANIGRELSLLKMAINMANADYLSFFLWNELEPRCQQWAAGSLELFTGKCDCNRMFDFQTIIKDGSLNHFLGNNHWWMPQDSTDDKSALFQVMAWCRQATSHYLKHCWLSSFDAITWVNCGPDLHHHEASLGHIELSAHLWN